MFHIFVARHAYLIYYVTKFRMSRFHIYKTNKCHFGETLKRCFLLRMTPIQWRIYQ
jgi:hypothetical protein